MSQIERLSEDIQSRIQEALDRQSDRLANEKQSDLDAMNRRNEQLIDLSHIPTDVRDSILAALDDAKPAPRSKMFSYFVEKRLRKLTEAIAEF